MESFNELCLKWWEGFYSSFQSSCTMTCISENEALNLKHGEMSILLGLGGDETGNLLDTCGIPDVDVIKFNQVLCQIETVCLPKIILMYEQYKSSLHLEDKEGGLIVDAFQLANDEVCQNTGAPEIEFLKCESDDTKIKHLEIISADDNYCLKPESLEPSVSRNVSQASTLTIVIPPQDESKPVLERSHAGLREASEPSKNLKEKSRDKESNDKWEESNFKDIMLQIPANESHARVTQSSFEKEKGEVSVTVSPTDTECPEHGSEVSRKEREHQNHEAAENKTNKIKENTVVEKSKQPKKMKDSSNSNQVRRSSRQVRVASKFADDHDVIMKLIKPDPSVIGGSPSEEKFPCVCSTCHRLFPDPVVLRIHWKSHKKNKSLRKCLPFYCRKCKLSFPSFQKLKIHHCSRNNHNHLGPEIGKENMVAKPPKPGKTMVSLEGNVEMPDSHDEQTDNREMRVPSESVGDVRKSRDTGSHVCSICNLCFQTGKLLKEHFTSHGENPYECRKCGKQLRNKRALLLHQQKKHGDVESSPLQCEQCQKKFVSLKTLEKHMEVHSGQKSFKCDECDKAFYLQQSLLNHSKSHKAENEFQCQECLKTFVDKRFLDNHQSIHTGEKPHVCEVCGKSFRIVRGLINHSRLHDKSLHLKCDLCPKMFIEKRGLEAHKLSHSGVKPFVCATCGKTFRRKLGLLNHSRIHDQSSAIKCDVCGKCFVDKWGMLKHKSIHTGEKPFTCNVCGKTFRIKKGLVDHVKLHYKHLQYKCDLCPRTFVEKRRLEMHVKAHQGEKAYVCDQCGQRFMNSMTLKVHKRRHTGEKPYKCSFCDKAFNQQGTLIAHERYHKGEKPYVCEVCGEGYVTKSHLTIHRRKHFNDRPFKCEQCDYAAFTFSLLRTHMLKHSSEKPFKCQVCPSAFKRPHHLDVHMRTHLSTELFQCQYCDDAFDSNKKYTAHLATHEIVVVTPHNAPDTVLSAQGPGEVAYDIVLFS